MIVDDGKTDIISSNEISVNLDGDDPIFSQSVKMLLAKTANIILFQINNVRTKDFLMELEAKTDTLLDEIAQDEEVNEDDEWLC